MKKRQDAIRRAELALRTISKKAQDYYARISDGSWIEEYNGEFIVKFVNDEEERYSSLKKLNDSFCELYEEQAAMYISEEIDELQFDYQKGRKIVKLYNEIFCDDWEIDSIIQDFKNDYLTINEKFAHYLDENYSYAIDLKNGEIAKGEVEIKEPSKAEKEVSEKEEPNSNGKRMNGSYEIIENCTYGNNELVIGYNPKAPSPYVCWYCDGGNNYYWGYYCNALSEARNKLNERYQTECEISHDKSNGNEKTIEVTDPELEFTKSTILAAIDAGYEVHVYNQKESLLEKEEDKGQAKEKER